MSKPSLWFTCCTVCLCWMGAAQAGQESDGPLKVESVGDGRQLHVRAELDEDSASKFDAGRLPQSVGERLLSMELIGEKGQPELPIFGRYVLRGRSLVYSPRFRLLPNRRYRIRLKLPDSEHVRMYRTPAATRGAATVVERIYPTAARLPANHLKFYIHFSQPMRETSRIFEMFQLVDESGKVIRDPWRHVELWSDDAKRLTLWIHPGRVKRGVNLREEFGPVLAPGMYYSLIVSSRMLDARGNPLARSYRKPFQAVAADVGRPLPQRWKLTPPRGRQRDALKLEFGEPLDQPLLFRFLKVLDADGQIVEGQIRVQGAESIWLFTPQRPWQKMKYRLVVDELLEDLAGNTPRRVFDADLQNQELQTEATLSLGFQPR